MMNVKMFGFLFVFVTQFESTPSRKEQNPLFLEIAQIELALFWQGQKIKDQCTVMAILGRTLYSPIQLHGGQSCGHRCGKVIFICKWFVNDSHYFWTWHLAEVNSYQQSSSSQHNTMGLNAIVPDNLTVKLKIFNNIGKCWNFQEINFPRNIFVEGKWRIWGNI